MLGLLGHCSCQLRLLLFFWGVSVCIPSFGWRSQSTFSLLKFSYFWKNNKLFHSEVSWETSICILCSGRNTFLLCLTTLDLLTVVRSLPLSNSSLVHLKVSTKLSVLMSFVVILQDSIREIYIHRVICHRLILISGKNHWKLTTHNFIMKFRRPPLTLQRSLIRLYVWLISESRITSFGPLLCCSCSFLRVYDQDFLL